METMKPDHLHDAMRSAQDFTRWAAFAIEVPDRHAQMLDAAKELREALDRLIDSNECICAKCGLRHGGAYITDPGF